MNPKYGPMSIEERLRAAEADLKSIIGRSRKNGASMVSLRDESYAVLGSYGLAQVKRCGWMDTGFHPWDRSKSAIVPAKVHDKIANFYQVGLSFLECSKAVSVGRPSGSAGDKHEEKNIEVTTRCEGILAQVKPGSLNQFSLTCNHTCQAVRAAMAEVRHQDTTIAPNWVINRWLLEQRDPGMPCTLAWDAA